MENNLWKWTDNFGSFESYSADKIKSLYFPLCNDALMSSISPDLHGDIKSNQNSFLLTPVSRIDLTDSRASRNFWVYLEKNKIWSATGVSKDLKQIESDQFKLEAGLLWHKISRENKKIGLKVEILSFVPAIGEPSVSLASRRSRGSQGEPVEIMQVTITNISQEKIEFTPIAAIPIYGRGAGNIRDHRHVTSLLQRVTLHKFGVVARPTLIFDETGHRPNKTNYFVFGYEDGFTPPEYIYPTQEMFCGDDGDLEAPASVLKNILPVRGDAQGKEAFGALRFARHALLPGKSVVYVVLMGITEDRKQIGEVIRKFNSVNKIKESLERTKSFWIGLSQGGHGKRNEKGFFEILQPLGLQDEPFEQKNSLRAHFDNWLRWVSIQPVLRKFFGCSFLPDFDYGKGGRGWRDLWQDCLGLILNDPIEARAMLVNNISGVRIDGSNATIIGKKTGEFIADRNDIARVWMDHGVWPLLTLNLYLDRTLDFDILFEEATYFRDQHIYRSRGCDRDWKSQAGNKLRTVSGKIYKGTIFEHLLIQNLAQFFNVGAHNFLRLEGADWNDGLDMAKENGESVAFSCMYAQNLSLLASLLEKTTKSKIKIAKEFKILLGKINYNDIKQKQSVLNNYFAKTRSCISGDKVAIDVDLLVGDLRKKSEWMMDYIRKDEWVEPGFFNGYYDNNKECVEGIKNNLVRMSLVSQVFPIMSGVATDEQIKEILKNVQKYLFDKKIKGYRLNTNFEGEQYDLGRAFSFAYGNKENGAFFNHMIVMFAYALRIRGFVNEAERALDSIYNMAVNTGQSKIYPCLPEYFDSQGRGMYSYLTGSASWFMLTMSLREHL